MKKTQWLFEQSNIYIKRHGSVSRAKLRASVKIKPCLLYAKRWQILRLSDSQ